MALIGELFGNYRVIAKLGEGGMGTVYLAEHPNIGRRVAIKLLKSTYWNNPQAIHRFVREARSTVNLRHPALVDIMDYGVHESTGSAYIMMEFLSGESLQGCIAREHRLGPARAASVARQIALGMDAVHRAGIIHRDLKPANVFLVADPDAPHVERIKILDFGIAKLLETDTASGFATATNMLLGTPHYMAPEQCRGAGHVDPRCDIYSLGCVLYEMLVGAPPFRYEWPGELIAAHLGETPPPPRSLNPSIPEAMEALVSRMMAKEPSARPSMRDAAHALGEFSSIEPSVPPVSLGPSNAPAASRDNGPTQSIFLQSSPDQPSTAGARSDEKRVSAGGVSAPGVASTRHPPFKLSRPVAFVAWGILGFATIVYAAVLRFTRVEPPAAPTVLTQPVQTAAESSAAPAPTSAAAVATAPEPPPAESAPPATEAAASVELPAPSTETIAKTSAAAAKAPGIERLDAVKPIRVTIANARRGLRIEVDGRESSFPLVLPRDKKTHLLVFSTRNFKPESRKIVADRDQSIVLENRPRQLYVP